MKYTVTKKEVLFHGGVAILGKEAALSYRRAYVGQQSAQSKGKKTITKFAPLLINSLSLPPAVVLAFS